MSYHDDPRINDLYDPDEGDVAMKIFESKDVPGNYKIAQFDALCAHFAKVVDGNAYFDGGETDDELKAQDLPTETKCVGFEVQDACLHVVMQIRGWGDLEGFDVELPEFGSQERTGDSWVDVPDEKSRRHPFEDDVPLYISGEAEEDYDGEDEN